MALVSQFQAFIFDYGGVLARHQTDADQARMAAAAGIAPERFTELYWAERDDYDRDLISGVEYWQRIGQSAGASLSIRTIEELTSLDTASWMVFDAVMWDWVDQLREAGKRVALLSNMPRDLGEAIRTQTDKLDHFDQVTLSYAVRSIKPDPAIYEHCLEGLGTGPEQTLFLDDRIANVQGAELLGIRAFQFTSRDEMLLRLRA
ncbi:MAG: HAD family phosphatase [Acidobacteriaceae bacterium]|nr:HAD family phosphatase [Acidobacteriaceae bacterium]